MLLGCASGYKPLAPESMNYLSGSRDNKVLLDYKYGLLQKKYAKSEAKKSVRLVSVKLTNQTDRDLLFGRDLKLTYTGGAEVLLLDADETYRELRQRPAIYLLYLLLTPANLYVNEGESQGAVYKETKSSTTPIGLVLGPGLAGGNMIAASSANKKFKADLEKYNLTGRVIKKGETVYGLVGMRTTGYDALKVMVSSLE